MSLQHGRSLLDLFYEALRWPGGAADFPHDKHHIEVRPGAVPPRKEASI